MEISPEVIKRYNVNVNPNGLNNVKRYNVNAERIAKDLAEKLNDDKSFLFFCKVAHNLTEAQIWNNLEQAQSGRNPKAYFAFLCKRELQRIEYNLS